jgi:DNA-binding transcriptional LysR family regulator
VAQGRSAVKLPDLDVKDLALVVALADTGRLTQAAVHVGLSVSAASHRLAALEHRLGVTLFYRGGDGLVLTPEGSRFIGPARSGLDAAMAAEAAVHQESPVIRLGSAWLMATTWLPPLIASLQHRDQHRTVELMTGRSREVARWVEDGRVAVGLVRASEVRPGTRAFVVGSDPVVLVAPAGHPWIQQPPSPAQLNQSPFVEVATDTGFGQFVADAKRDLGFTWTATVRVDHLEAALALVEAGVGPALLPLSLVERRSAQGSTAARLVPIEGVTWPRRPLALVIRSGEELPAWAAAWPELMRSLVRRRS